MEYIGNMGAFAWNYSINCSFTNSLESMNRLLSFCVFVNCQCQLVKYNRHNGWASPYCLTRARLWNARNYNKHPLSGRLQSLSRPHAYRKAGAVSSHILVQKISVIRPVRVHNTDRYIVRGTCLVDTLDLSV